jgi:hypothetical protein
MSEHESIDHDNNDNNNVNGSDSKSERKPSRIVPDEDHSR